jgi:hypothetical protein
MRDAGSSQMNVSISSSSVVMSSVSSIMACLLAQLPPAQTVEGLAESLVVMSADKIGRSQG